MKLLIQNNNNLSSFRVSNSKVLIFSKSTESCIFNEYIVQHQLEIWSNGKFETKLCKEGYKSISFVKSTYE